MKQVYLIFVNLLLFFFITTIFTGTIAVRENTVVDKLLVGAVFGVFMMLVPTLLGFFKISVNAGSLLLMGIVVSFIFFILSIYLLDFINITGGQVDLGISNFEIKFQDRTVALIVLSTVSAILSVILETLRGEK